MRNIATNQMLKQKYLKEIISFSCYIKEIILFNTHYPMFLRYINITVLNNINSFYSSFYHQDVCEVERMQINGGPAGPLQYQVRPIIKMAAQRPKNPR